MIKVLQTTSLNFNLLALMLHKSLNLLYILRTLNSSKTLQCDGHYRVLNSMKPDTGSFPSGTCERVSLFQAQL